MSASSTLSRIRVVDYGVLGTQLVPGSGIVTQAEPPDDFTAFVDPAGLQFIQRFGPSGAGGASGSIYEHIGIRDDDAFPDDVREAITEECEAHYHRYEADGGVHHCIHTVGPMLGHGKYTWAEAVAKLAGAYRNVLSQFVRFAVSKVAADPAPKGTPVRLRLLPISGGIFAGEYQRQIAPLTLAALQAGIGLLTEEERSVLAMELQWEEGEEAEGAAQIELCVFLAVELADFHAAMAEQMQAEQPVAAGDGGGKTVRNRKPKPEVRPEPEAPIFAAARQRRAMQQRQVPEEAAMGAIGTTQKRTGWSVSSAVAAAVLVGLAAYAFCTAMRDAAAIYAYATRDDEADSVWDSQATVPDPSESGVEVDEC